ncbi:hypothetical protein [Streptomyces avidinii]|uniref:Uncharacterized protein n=1 Tax=Streptomyces avidinii TaxID=1895 RepID=A0ABS4L3Y0_STRAV|nr:hypothetical protein [Streptomyces avidinii]MBP2036798.1 hypothetical protein [Streptomyces avidinii]GGY93027.1 hypothetical protein GCM10010343_17710 [Streptomyces avidinii]
MLVDEFLQKTDSELYALLGSSLLGETIGAAPSDPDRPRRFGREWFNGQLGALRTRICGHERLKGVAGTSVSDRAIDAHLLFEILGDFGGNPANTALIAVLAARIGVGTLCSGYTSQHDG